MASHAVKENQDSDADSEEDERSKCPACGKKLKNVLLHLKKSPVCHTGVCEEDYKKIVEQSQVKRKKKKKLWEIERRKKDIDKFKTEQNKRTQKSRDLARENDLEEIVENKFPTSVEEEELRYLHLEDGLCPCCQKQCKNLLLHVSKSPVCRNLVKEGDIQKLSEKRKRIRQNRAKDKAKKMRANMPGKENGRKNKYDAEWRIKCPGCDEDMRNILLHLNYNEECRATVSEEDYKKMEEQTLQKRGKIQLESLRDMQNRWKAKSREKAREEDYEKVKKYQRESTAKWRDKEKKKDPELFLARTQLWRKRYDGVPWYELEKGRQCPQTLRRNIHRLVDISSESYYCKLTCRLNPYLHTEDDCRYWHFGGDKEEDRRKYPWAGEKDYERKRWWLERRITNKEESGWKSIYIRISEEEAKEIGDDEAGVKLFIEKIERNDADRIYHCVPIELRTRKMKFVNKRNTWFIRITKEEADEIGNGVCLTKVPKEFGKFVTTEEEEKKIGNGCWVEFRKEGLKYIRMTKEEAVELENKGLGRMKLYIEKLKQNKQEDIDHTIVDC